MQLMLDTVGGADPRYVWWNATVGRTNGVTYVDLEQICALPAFTYPAMTQQNIAALGLKEIFRLWMFEYLQSLYRVE